MSFAFWACLSLVAYAYVGYPAMMWLLATLFPRDWKRAAIEPRVSIVFAVHNGAGHLAERLRNLAELDYPAHLLEVIAVSDGSTDETPSILRGLTSLPLHAVIREEREGKAAALNVALRQATGEIVFFTDVRPCGAPDSLRALVSNFADPRVGCAAGTLALAPTIDAHSSTQGVGMYWRYEEFLRLCEAKLHSSVGVYGGFYAIRRELIEPFPPDLILDDVYQPMCAVRKGYRVVLDPSAKVYDRWPEKQEKEFTRKVRTLVGNFQLLQFCPWLLSPRFPLAAQFLSHKLLRLVAPWALICALVACAMLRHDRFYAAAAIAQIVLYCVGAWGIAFPERSRRWASVPAAFLLLNAAAVVAWSRAFRSGSVHELWQVQQKS